MIEKQYPEILLVRFTKAQRAYLRKKSRINKMSEAQMVRMCVDVVKRGVWNPYKNPVD